VREFRVAVDWYPKNGLDFSDPASVAQRNATLRVTKRENRVEESRPPRPQLFAGPIGAGGRAPFAPEIN
jgi:hypothetical protein